MALALQEFQGAPRTKTVKEASERTGLSQRRFIQLFREEVGLTPKLFCRVRRFQEVLRLIGDGRRAEWAEVALRCGYFDQAHLVHDFRAFSGTTPADYLAAASTPTTSPSDRPGRPEGSISYNRSALPGSMLRRAKATSFRKRGRMTNRIDPVPEGFHTVTPYLTVPDADALVSFMGRAFGAEETFRARGAHGGTHVEVRVGDSMVMIGGLPSREPQPAAIFLYMDGVDGVYRRALEAGASPIEEPADRPADGDRRAGFADPFGNAWFVAARIEDVSREELRKRHGEFA